MSLADYQNRTVDILAYQGGKAGGGDVLLQPEVVGADYGGNICTGVQKLAQRFVLKLLTEKNSIQHLPEEGTTFMTEARRQIWVTPLDVHAAFSAAVEEIRQQLTQEQLDTDPDDEILAAVEILEVTLDNALASIRVRLSVASGSTTQFIVPISTTL